MRINIYRGDSKTIIGTVRNQDGDVVDITGGTVVLSVKKYPTDITYILTKTGTVVDGVNGKFSIVFMPSETEIEPGEYYYDIELRLGNDKYTIVKNILTILVDITR